MLPVVLESSKCVSRIENGVIQYGLRIGYYNHRHFVLAAEARPCMRGAGRESSIERRFNTVDLGCSVASHL